MNYNNGARPPPTPPGLMLALALVVVTPMIVSLALIDWQRIVGHALLQKRPVVTPLLWYAYLVYGLFHTALVAIWSSLQR